MVVVAVLAAPFTWTLSWWLYVVVLGLLFGGYALWATERARQREDLLADRSSVRVEDVLDTPMRSPKLPSWLRSRGGASGSWDEATDVVDGDSD